MRYKWMHILAIALIALPVNVSLEARRGRSDCPTCQVGVTEKKVTPKMGVVNRLKKWVKPDCKSCNQYVSPKAKPKAQIPSAKMGQVSAPAYAPEKLAAPKPQQMRMEAPKTQQHEMPAPKPQHEKPVSVKEEKPAEPIEIKGGELVEIETKKQFAEYKSADMPVMVEIYAPWCGPCKTMKPKLEKLAKEMPDIVIAKLDGDRLKSITSEYKITGFPHFLFFKDGKLVGRTSGGMDIDLMGSYICKFLGEKEPAAPPKEKKPTISEEKPVDLKEKPKLDQESKAEEREGGELIELNSLEEFKKYRAADKKVLIEVYASWCGPCKGMVPKLQKLAKEMPEIVFAKVDGCKISAVSKEYEINGYPTFLFFENGKKVGRTSGGMDIEFMRNYINKFFGKKSAEKPAMKA